MVFIVKIFDHFYEFLNLSSFSISSLKASPEIHESSLKQYRLKYLCLNKFR